jgi:hypothetical protein
VTVTAPDVSVWWDAAAVASAALAQLRLEAGDVDAGRVVSAVDPAGQAINQYLDRDPADAYTVATAPPQLQDAVVQVTVELYRRKDAPPTSIDGMLAGAWRPASIDPLSGVRSLIAPFRARRGIG